METINVLDGREDLGPVARKELKYSLEDNDIVLTDAELDAAAKRAVEIYAEDNIRAACWTHAMETVLEELSALP